MPVPRRPMPRLVLAIVALALASGAAPEAAAQEAPFEVEIAERADLTRAPALHSAAWAEHGGRWLFVTGRGPDASGEGGGMHEFSAPAFPRRFANGSVHVYEPETDARWSASLDALPEATAEALRVANAQFLARGDSLIVVGGYGWREEAGDFVTFGTMTVLDVPGTMAAVVDETDLAPHVSQPVAWEDALAVTGGHLIETVDGALAIVGGNRFDGEYGGGQFTQTYTQSVRVLDRAARGLDAEVTDPQLHRRDGNVAPVVLSHGEVAHGVFGGVFNPRDQTAYTRPFVIEKGTELLLQDDFEQHVGLYTAPALGLYSAASGATHTAFFGGISGSTWDDAAGEWRRAGNPPFFPFVDDVGVVSYNAGEWSERRLDVRMPGLLGANAAFLLDPALPLVADGLVDFDALPGGATRAGWIVGGIEAGAPSFGQTWASRRVLEVTVVKTVSPANETGAAAGFALAAPAPNPARGQARLALRVDRPQALRAEVLDVTGRRVALLHDGPLAEGEHALAWDAAGAAPGVYLVRVGGDAGRAVRRVTLAR